MRNRLLATFSILALSLGVAACADNADDAEDAELDESSDESKTDQPDIALTKVEFGAPVDRFEAKVGVIKSKTAWKQVFGVAAPSSINFDQDWVAYYTAGTQSSGGYTANITHVRLSDTGKTLKISARLDKPGFDCLNAAVITFPYAIVKFHKPSPVTTANRYYQEVRVIPCGQACSGGTIVNEPTYNPTGTGNQECLVEDPHCVTNDHSACPQLTPLPPTFCPNGTVKTEHHYISSADGMECSMPSAHCVTNDSSACPQLTPLPPNWCPNGIIKSEPRFIDSADGMECLLPRLHCVISGASCPQ
jgi:hypothetical protein